MDEVIHALKQRTFGEGEGPGQVSRRTAGFGSGDVFCPGHSHRREERALQALPGLSAWTLGALLALEEVVGALESILTFLET